MSDLISREELYEKAVALEATALDYVCRLIERDGDEPSVEWKIWSAILTERTAFKHDVFDAPSAQQWIPVTERLPEDGRFVLVQTDGGDAMIMRLCFETNAHGKRRYYWKTYEESIEWRMEYIVAWMRLHEPYKEEAQK